MHEKLEKNFWDTAKNIGEIKRSPLHPVVKFFSEQRIQYMKKYMDFNSIHAALDVGCGTGFSSCNFPSFIKLVGLDFSYRNLTLNPMKEKTQASAYYLPFKSNSFDLVYGWDFLHHLDSSEISIDEMARVTKKYLVLFEPNSNNPIQFIYGLLNRQERGTLQFNKKKMLALIKKIKFRIISCDSVGWIFAGASPQFSLGLATHFPFIHKLGISSVIICEKN